MHKGRKIFVLQTNSIQSHGCQILQEKIVPPESLPPIEKKKVLSKLTQVIEYRIVTSDLPACMCKPILGLHLHKLNSLFWPYVFNVVFHLSDSGRVKFLVDHEFEVWNFWVPLELELICMWLSLFIIGFYFIIMVSLNFIVNHIHRWPWLWWGTCPTSPGDCWRLTFWWKITRMEVRRSWFIQSRLTSSGKSFRWDFLRVNNHSMISTTAFVSSLRLIFALIKIRFVFNELIDRSHFRLFLSIVAAWSPSLSSKFHVGSCLDGLIVIFFSNDYLELLMCSSGWWFCLHC